MPQLAPPTPQLKITRWHLTACLLGIGALGSLVLADGGRPAQATIRTAQAIPDDAAWERAEMPAPVASDREATGLAPAERRDNLGDPVETFVITQAPGTTDNAASVVIDMSDPTRPQHDGQDLVEQDITVDPRQARASSVVILDPGPIEVSGGGSTSAASNEALRRAMLGSDD